MRLPASCASRTATLLLGFGGGKVGVKIRFVPWVRRAVACVVKGSFRALRLGLRRCF